MAAAVMNSRSLAFVTRSQSFMDRGVARHHISASESNKRMNYGFSDWMSHDGDDLNKFKKFASFRFRNTMAGVSQPEYVKPDVPWVHSLVSSESSEIFAAKKQNYDLYKHLSSPWAEQIVA
ncbi:unnamed protein product [Lathyrus sativus]|nr:unnamed protein product [Lathyrus sativus]